MAYCSWCGAKDCRSSFCHLLAEGMAHSRCWMKQVNYWNTLSGVWDLSWNLPQPRDWAHGRPTEVRMRLEISSSLQSQSVQVPQPSPPFLQVWARLRNAIWLDWWKDVDKWSRVTSHKCHSRHDSSEQFMTRHERGAGQPLTIGRSKVTSISVNESQSESRHAWISRNHGSLFQIANALALS